MVHETSMLDSDWGNTEGTNSSKNLCLRCVSVCFVQICVRTDFGELWFDDKLMTCIQNN